MIVCKTEAEARAALDKDENAEIEVAGEFSISISAGSPLFSIASALSFSIVAWGSSQPRVVAWWSSQPRVEARGSSRPRVEAWGYVQLSLFGRRISATASAMVSVLLDGGATCSGGNQVEVRRHTPEEWCSYYGLPVVDGVVTLFKALNSGFRSPYGGDYTPGTVPVAADWDGGVKECGGGLHFSPSPRAALEFNDAAVCFVACPVALADLSIHPDGSMPQKVKARGCCAPVWEVDEDGNRIERQQAAA